MSFFPQWVNHVRASRATPAMAERERQREEAIRKATDGILTISPPQMGGNGQKEMGSEEGPRLWSAIYGD